MYRSRNKVDERRAESKFHFPRTSIPRESVPIMLMSRFHHAFIFKFQNSAHLSTKRNSSTLKKSISFIF